MTKNNQKIIFRLIPIMLTFFAMGFVDLVGIASNYVKADFGLSDSLTNLLPSMVFFWFLILSVPTGMLMDKIGRRKTVLLSLAITLAAMLVPLIDYNLPLMVFSFALLGIGNTLMQVSLNPLLSNIIHGNKLSSALTFGQFVKNIAAFSAPILTAWAIARVGDWKLIYPIFMLEGVVALLAMAKDTVKERISGHASTFKQCFSLLKDPLILFCFIGIMCHVGIDVGTNVTAPKILTEKIGMSLAAAGYATSIYFFFKTAGSFMGAFILARFSHKRFFAVSAFIMLAAVIGLFVFSEKLPLYICIALIGFGNSNIFSIIFAQAILHKPSRKNDISGLMIMGLFGGTVFPFLMGITADVSGSQTGSVAVMSLGILFLLYMIRQIKQAH